MTDLTHGQRQIWVGQRLNPESPLYNMAFAWTFAEELQVDRFQEAWHRVVDSSDALRTRIVLQEGDARRGTLPAGAVETVVLDGEALLQEGADEDEGFFHWCHQRCARPLDLTEGLVDSVLVGLGNGKIGWYLNVHHLVSDAWSTVLLYRQVAAEYGSLRSSNGKERPEPLLDFYSTVATRKVSDKARSAALDHWEERRQLSRGAVPFYGRSGRPMGTASRRWTLQLDDRRQASLDRLCGEAGFASLSSEMSRFALLGTLLMSWLHRISGRSDLGFDAPVAGRPNGASKRALGLFIEMFPFAVEVAPQETFRSLGAKCLAESQLFLRHGQPETSAPSGKVAGNVVLNYFPDSFGEFDGIPADVRWVHPGHGDSVHALRLQAHDFAATRRLTLHFDFNVEVLSETQCRRGLRHFETLLDALIEDPDQAIASIDVRTDEERRAWDQLNATGSVPEPTCTVLDLFDEGASSHPQRIALRQGNGEMSFEELRQRSENLATHLVASGVGPGDRVAILAGRSMDAVVAILGTLRARAAYVPLDPAYPKQRLEGIVEDSGARLLLVGDETGEEQSSWLGRMKVPALSIRAACEKPADDRETRPDPSPPSLDDLAYVLYTSGSTGRPKGVLVEHRGLSSYLTWADRQYVRGDRLRFPLFTSMAFDLTITSLFLPLITGGTLEIYPHPQGPVDSAWMDLLRDNAVDFIKLTPSHLSLFQQMDLSDSKIRRMVVGGEDFKRQLAADIAASFEGELEIYNEYGPTEAVVGCVMHRFDPQEDDHLSVPIGVPADDVQVEVLNHAQAPVPHGVPGELWVSRLGLARGYLGQPTLTAERFQVGPTVDSEQAGQRRYRTGDRVRLLESSQLEDGVLEYLGRLDRQLKISGHRVEPAEIEGAMLALPGVEHCAVVARSPKGAAEEAGGRAEEDLQYCRQCGLPSNQPRVVFDREGVCNVCRTYASTREHAQDYFGDLDQLRQIFEASARRRPSRQETDGAPSYDCMMLFSGGKDSTYALCRLVEMGLSVYTFTLDNGFISEGAKANIRRVTAELGVPVEFATTPAMNAIFRDSLERFSNVCQGCFKTIYTLSTQRALELGIPIIVTGLSRGQMFETRLTEEMFRDGRRNSEEVDAAVLAARKVYHRLDDEVARSLDVDVFRGDEVFEQVRFVDFYRYCDVGLSEVLAYLNHKVPWVRPEDTGRSTNCLINDVGIYVHKQRRGFHNYALPYSWDVRMGHKTREEAHDELHDAIDVDDVRRILTEIGCDPDQMTRDRSQPQLVAYYVASEDVTNDDLRQALRDRLPSAIVPTHLVRLDAIPLTVHGKVDEGALPDVDMEQLQETHYRAPDGPVEEFLAEVWRDRLAVDRVGGDDHFFELGGTSLGAMEVMIRLCQEFDLELPLETLFSHPTLSGLARVAEDRILEDVGDLSGTDQDLLQS